MATGTGRSARSHGLSSWATRWTNMQTKGDREWLPAATVDPSPSRTAMISICRGRQPVAVMAALELRTSARPGRGGVANRGCRIRTAGDQVVQPCRMQISSSAATSTFSCGAHHDSFSSNAPWIHTAIKTSRQGRSRQQLGAQSG
jgi:hypothetical protein